MESDNEESETTVKSFEIIFLQTPNKGWNVSKSESINDLSGIPEYC